MSVAFASASFFLVASAPPAYANKNKTQNPGEIAAVLPKTKPSQPVLMLVSLDRQSMQVYAGDTLMARSKVSSGKKGHRTPTGIFSILQKNRHHHSNIYSQAPMPYMQRLTWSGIALHESSSVPDRPASHGCVRLPGAFAKQLFGYTRAGAHVLITDEELYLSPVWSRNLFYPDVRSEDQIARIDQPSAGLSQPIQRAEAPIAIRLAQNTKLQSEDLNRDDSSVGDNFVLRSSLNQPFGSGPDNDGFQLPESTAPIRILITRRTGRELVRDIQTMLNELGFNAGKQDGWIGRDTGNAIVRFQKSLDLNPTGSVSLELARLLHGQSREGDFPVGRIYVRQNFKPLFDAPVGLRDPKTPLGTHFLSALTSPDSSERLRWIHAALPDMAEETLLSDIEIVEGQEFASAPSIHDTLHRIEMPQYARDRITAMIVPGSSLVINDGGLNNESFKGTDFIVLTKTAAKD